MIDHFEGEGFEKAKEEMKLILNDLKLRIQKLKDNPKPDQLPSLMEKIHSDQTRLTKIAAVIGGQVESDFETLCDDLDQFLKVSEDKAAFSQVMDDISILINEIS